MTSPHPPLQEYYTGEHREEFVRDLFDSTAPHYDAINRIMSFGTGRWYRKRTLERLGLKAGMHLLDMATGTGLLARAAQAIGAEVTGLDLSRGMLREAQAMLHTPLVQGRGESLPFGDETFDFLSMGYGLRHLSDLESAFREWHRVLRPGGRAVMIEITTPKSRIGLAFASFYLGRVVPLVSRIRTRDAQAQKLMRYFWDTIRTRVSEDTILSALRSAGFGDVGKHSECGVFTAYFGQRA